MTTPTFTLTLSIHNTDHLAVVVEALRKLETAALAPEPRSKKAKAVTTETVESEPVALAANTAATLADAGAGAVDLTTVRAQLAELSKAGKAAAVKQLIAEMGAAKLTDIPAERYSELMAKAGAL